jgi:hypothetical protein
MASNIKYEPRIASILTECGCGYKTLGLTTMFGVTQCEKCWELWRVKAGSDSGSR